MMEMKNRKLFCFILLGFFLVIFSSKLPAQDSAYARNVIKTLASPAFKGRGYAFKGDSIAANFISKEFSRFALNKWTENYYQTYYVSINVFEGNTEINFKKNYPSSTCSDAMQIAAYSATAKGEFSIIPATEKMLKNKFDSSKTKDKFIAVDMTRYVSNKEKRSQWNHLIDNNTLQAKGYILLVERLPSYSPRRGQTKSSHTTVLLLKDSLSGKLKNVYMDLDASFVEQYQTQNVCGYVEGKLYPDTFFVIGAHYDHLGQIGANYTFHGANDNASGTAMMMDLARHFSRPENKPDYSMAFIAFSGEEIGLLGSSYFVDNMPVPASNIKMMLNLDMVGTGEDGFTFEGGTTFPDEFEKFASINNQENYTPELVSKEGKPNSDHYPFFKKGCKAMFVFSMGGKAG
ncbi:MAG: M28 family peptidase, partial [Bacteroidales bacterium]|nr:M28 family peptidase [Bacteroidales bacterium]